MDVNAIIGKPYQLGARGPEAFDCWGVVVWVYERLSFPLPGVPTAGMSRADIVRVIRGHGADHVGLTYRQAAEPLPWCLMADDSKGHVGVVLPGNLVLHASATHGVVAHRMEHFLQFYPAAKAWTCHK